MISIDLQILTKNILLYMPSFVFPMHLAVLLVVIIMFFYWYLGYCLYRMKLPKNDRAFMVRFSPPDLPLDHVLVLQTKAYIDQSSNNQAALLTDLARRKIIRFDHNRKKFKVNIAEWRGRENSLTNCQQSFLEKLTEAGEDCISYKRQNSVLFKALIRLIQPLAQHKKHYYHVLLPWFNCTVVGLLCAVIAFLPERMGTGISSTLIFVMPGAIFIWFLFYTFIRSLSWHRLISNIIGLITMSMFALLIALFPLGVAVGFESGDQLYSALLMVVILVISCTVIFLYINIVKAIKPEHLDAQQQVEEFKYFLSGTKSDEYQVLTPDLFEEYLPYAIGLGVYKNWIELYQSLYPKQYRLSTIAGGISAYTIISSSTFKRAGTSRSSGRR